MEKKPKLRLHCILKFTLEREEYLDVVVDPQERRFMTDMRGGTNLLRVEMGRWKGEQLEDRTCIFCAMGVVEDEAHALLQCSTYYRERYRLYVHIRNRTDYDVSKMQQDQDWLLQMLLGVGCPGKKQRADIQSLVANYVGEMFRTRARLLEAVDR